MFLIKFYEIDEHVVRKCEKYIHGFNPNTSSDYKLGKPRCRWQNNIKMDLKAMWLEDGLDTSGSG
jgi:hypothetical protein